MDSRSETKRWARDYPNLGDGPVSIAPDVSPEYFELERERIFRRAWLAVGRIDEIPNPGDYFTKELEILKTSIIVIRGKDGMIRAFHNVCVHRGNRLCPRAAAGSTKGFFCMFHGWTYDLEGNLANAPNAELFGSDFDKKEIHLVQLAAEVWEGFIFVNADPKPAETLREWLGELYDQFEGYPFDQMTLATRYEATVNANWKPFIDAFTEAYHAPFLHRRSLRDALAGAANPYCRFNSVRIHRRHRSASVYANPAYVPTPVEGMTFKHASTPLYPATSASSDSLPSGINPDRNPLWAFDINLIFPTFELGVANGYFLFYMYWPISVNQTRWEARLYLKPALTAGDVFSQEYSIVHSRDVAREDLSTLEGTQQMMESGVIDRLHLCDEEILVRHNYKVVEDFLGVEPDRSRPTNASRISR